MAATDDDTAGNVTGSTNFFDKMVKGHRVRDEQELPLALALSLSQSD